MTATCKLGENGCWNDGKCRATSNCEHKAVTNADRIRAMSDEELAEFIRDVSYECQDAYCGPHCQICSYPWCSSERTMEWLKQPAEEAAP